MAIPYTYTAGQVLEAASLNANFTAVYDTYATYTPTVTGWTQGNATFNAKYAVSGDTVHAFGEFIVGSTTAVTASNLNLSLPVTANDSPHSLGFSMWTDVSAGSSVAGYSELITTTTMNLTWLDPEAAPIAVRLEQWKTGVTLPFTIATGDYIRWDLFYRKA